MLAETGEVVGETKSALSMYGQLKDGNKLPDPLLEDPDDIYQDHLEQIFGNLKKQKIR